MADRQTLGALTRLSRSAPVRRELCCPVCGGETTLKDGVHGCPLGHSFGTLAELAVVGTDSPGGGRTKPLPSRRLGRSTPDVNGD